MNSKRSKIEYTTGAFNSVDKANKKGYNESNKQDKIKSIFDSDAFAKSALDYLYSDANRGKTA